MTLDFTKRLARIETGEEVFVAEGPDRDGDYWIRYADGRGYWCRAHGECRPYPDRNIRQATPDDIARWDAPEPAPMTDANAVRKFNLVSSPPETGAVDIVFGVDADGDQAFFTADCQHSQNLVIVEERDGKLVLSVRRLFNTRLCEAFGIKRGEHPPIYIEGDDGVIARMCEHKTGTKEGAAS